VSCYLANELIERLLVSRSLIPVTRFRSVLAGPQRLRVLPPLLVVPGVRRCVTGTRRCRSVGAGPL